VIATLAVLVATAAHAAEAPIGEPAVLQEWLSHAATLKSWSANFTQTRHLQALAQPLTSPGRVWFQAPDRFRWELGQPAQSLVLRDGPDLWLLSPALHRAEFVSLTNAAPGPLRDALALLDTGFPQDAATFRRQYKLLGVQTNAAVGPPPSEPTYTFRLQPRAPGANRFLPEMNVIVTVASYQLAATELRFADGSRLRNDFTAAVQNPELTGGLFRTNLDAAWKITSAGAAKKQP